VEERESSSSKKLNEKTNEEGERERRQTQRRQLGMLLSLIYLSS
jgi:hypothetical protein